ncbi:GspH/FimT family pseudopilin [Methylomicrobium lacus]|uniref:GspH/FimT family pseudopilin n=1 Tax=Methylomicrobium lacus TaxID=136992 RepID=UPI0009FF79B0|nr:GspH/FimT family pseudopilin [Methylomicrobium lacus]
MNRFKATGFTLIEAMIVVAIMGILVATAFPSFQRMLETNRLKQVAESLKSDMQLARTEAIKRSKYVIVSTTTGNNGSWCYGLTETTSSCSKTSCDCAETNTADSDYCEIKRVLGSNFNSAVNITSTTSANTIFDFKRGVRLEIDHDDSCKLVLADEDDEVRLTTTNFQTSVVSSNTGRSINCTPSGQNGIIGYPPC